MVERNFGKEQFMKENVNMMRTKMVVETRKCSVIGFV